MKKRITVRGRVQGVCFRAFVRDAASDMGIFGTVRNLGNGDVEIVFQGSKEKLPAFMARLSKGSPWSRVDDLLVEDLESDRDFNSFQVIY